MSAPGWRTAHVVQVRSRTGSIVPIRVGLIEAGTGSILPAALKIGNGDEVFLPDEIATQLIVNIRETVAERLKITGEHIGGETS
ncbi:MAG TPA: hypothetical protein VGX25_03935 [Actinophytocola sp.]|uniref:hypothetical protein n=1 Tax=Actinophytocola sp. TaxID=1872138 RepID=UPI002DDDAFE9|nr:hypothetical protein [Actinophytocola sp.]HEV2778528.1 hypothetical protein [Actinophytocola sp.]